MNLSRRALLHLGAGVAALPVLPRMASALDYPTRPVHLIVGFAAGGPNDVSARLIGQWLPRYAALPDIPALAEVLPGYEVTSWFGVGAPKNAPADIVDKLNKETTAGLADPRIKERLADLGGVPMPMSATEFGKLIGDETEKWAKLIKFAGIKPE